MILKSGMVTNDAHCSVCEMLDVKTQDEDGKFYCSECIPTCPHCVGGSGGVGGHPRCEHYPETGNYFICPRCQTTPEGISRAGIASLLNFNLTTPDSAIEEAFNAAMANGDILPEDWHDTSCPDAEDADDTDASVPIADTSASVAEVSASVARASNPAAHLQQTSKVPFVIDSEEKAEWYLAKRAGLIAERDRIKANAAKRVEQIEKDLGSLDGFCEPMLITFVKTMLAKFGGGAKARKSHTFLNGTVSFRTMQEKGKIIDAGAARTFAETDKESFLRGVIKDVPQFDSKAYFTYAVHHLQETGELLPGFDLVPEHESVSINHTAKE